MKLACIGLGAMGLPIAANLNKGDDLVRVFDVSQTARAQAEELGFSVCETVKEAAKEADVVFLSLPNAAIIEGVVHELANLCPENAQLVADFSSIAPSSAKKMEEILWPADIGYADCPVSGGVGGAKAGTLTVMVGAADETFALLWPFLQRVGKNIHHLGPVGTGSAIKMVNNYLLGCNMAAVAEALVLGAQLGLSAGTMQEIIQSSSGRSFVIENKVPDFIQKRQFKGGFQVDLEYKDLGLFCDAAKELGMPIPMGSTALQVFQQARAKGFGKEDISSLVKIWEELMGIEVQ